MLRTVETAAIAPTVRRGESRVLYLTHRVPFPPDKGDRIRNYHVLRQLANRAKVSLIALADEPVPPATLTALQAMCERVEIVPVGKYLRWLRAGFSALTFRSLSEGAFHEPGVDGVVKRFLKDTTFDAALVSASSLAPYLQRSGLQHIPGFVDLVDVDSQKWFDFAESCRGPKRWLYQFEGRRVRKLEQSLPRWAKAVSIVSAAEATVYESFAGVGTATMATNGVDLEYYQPVDPHAPTESACAFVGALDYLPNVDAAIWFAHDVWPAIRAKQLQAEFWIIGRKPTPSVQKLGELPGIKVIGQVPDVRPYVAKAAITVVPMRLSRGLQNKVLEAMAMAKAVVAAPPALAALRVEPSKHLLVARTTEEWVSAVSQLLGSPERRQELGAAGREFVEEHHHWDKCLRPILDKICPV